LRTTVDAVLFEDGHVEEGVPGSHGQGMLQLNPRPLGAGPSAVLVSLHAGGVRSVLLSADRTIAEPFVRAGLVDQIVVHLAVEGPRTSPRFHARQPPWSLMPPGFEVASIERLGTQVKVVGVPPAHAEH
jgi:diaminohydroxyphosphoribosylaminopyrimidine deaminase/5-amino-6-(5-phosphoribosylamino)uracil reductase